MECGALVLGTHMCLYILIYEAASLKTAFLDFGIHILN